MGNSSTDAYRLVTSTSIKTMAIKREEEEEEEDQVDRITLEQSMLTNRVCTALRYRLDCKHTILFRSVPFLSFFFFPVCRRRWRRPHSTKFGIRTAETAEIDQLVRPTSDLERKREKELGRNVSISASQPSIGRSVSNLFLSSFFLLFIFLFPCLCLPVVGLINA